MRNVIPKIWRQMLFLLLNNLAITCGLEALRRRSWQKQAMLPTGENSVDF